VQRWQEMPWADHLKAPDLAKISFKQRLERDHSTFAGRHRHSPTSGGGNQTSFKPKKQGRKSPSRPRSGAPAGF
jgi:hypothetical protein